MHVFVSYLKKKINFEEFLGITNGGVLFLLKVYVKFHNDH